MRRLGEILASPTTKTGAVVEWGDRDGDWHQVDAGDDDVRSWSSGAWWYARDLKASDLRRPARVVPDSVSNQDPATRGPIVATATRAERAREIVDQAVEDLAAAIPALGIEVRTIRSTAVCAAMSGGAIAEVRLIATVHDADEVVP